jgi:hypothetical protein
MTRLCRNNNLTVQVRALLDADVCHSTVLFNCFFSVTYILNVTGLTMALRKPKHVACNF